MRLKLRLAALVGLLTFTGLVAMTCMSPSPESAPDGERYAGTRRCQSCHDSEAGGDQSGHWARSSHARAFHTLATEAARKIAASRGIDDPQSAPECLRCHVTAYHVDETRTRALRHEEGIGCESCHGPGDAHSQARLAASGEGASTTLTPLPRGEIDARPLIDNCLSCHNPNSPTYRPFCFQKRWVEIAHLDPRKNRSPAQIDAMKCTCGERCECARGECGNPYGN